MPQFGKRSREKLDKADPQLITLFEEVIKEMDCSILESHRDKERQNKMLAEGKSKVSFPKSRHNSFPSKAVDVAPYPVDWSNNRKNIARFYYFAGYVKGKAHTMGIKIRWGGDWDSDNSFDDQSFDDLPHSEIVGGA